jgi:hypothetical protein
MKAYLMPKDYGERPCGAAGLELLGLTGKESYGET